MTQVYFRMSPVHEPEHCFDVPAGLTVAEILARAETPDWFPEHGGVYLDGVKAPDGTWHVRAVAEQRVDIVVMPGSKKILPVLLSVAAVALTAGIGAFGVPFLGAGFAAGTFGASAVAAGVGLGSSLLISALTAPPKIGQDGGTPRQIGEGGSTSNPIVRWELLPNVLGEMRVSPPLLAPPFTSIDGDDTWTEAVVGLEGWYSIDAASVLINGTAASDYQGATIEVREGGPADAARTVAVKSVVEHRDGKKLENFKTESNAVWYERLIDQATPDNSAPAWVYFETDGTWDKVSFRVVLPQGATESGTAAAFVPVRIECRKVGDATWRKLPTFHLWDAAIGTGPVRGEIEFIREKWPAGVHYSHAPEENWPINEVNCWTAIGQSFEYKSDDYFQIASNYNTSLIPVMTGSTTSGVTVSSSNELFGYEAFRACDAFGAFRWETSSSPGLVYFTVEFSAATTVRSYAMSAISTGSTYKENLPGVFWMEAWDGAAWIRIDDTDTDQRNAPYVERYCQIGNPGSYTKYRLAVSENSGGATGAVTISSFAMYAEAAPCCVFGGGSGGNKTSHAANSYPRATNLSLHRDGCRVYLDPDDWDAGQYEFRVKRGWAGADVLFVKNTYTYAGSATIPSFFEYVLSSGYYTIERSQQDFRTDTQIEVFATHETVAPFEPAGIAHIAVKVKNVRVDSISAVFQRRQRGHDGAVWQDTWEASSNPASQMRDILLGMSNHDPVPGEIIAEDELEIWFNRCVTETYACNAYVQGESISDVLQMVASCGYASPRTAEVWGVVEDYDTSAEPVRLVISPINSSDQGTSLDLPKTPHVVQVEFADAADDYKTGYALVYAEGYSASTLPGNFRTETWQMRGHTSEAAAVARAAFDLKQARLRKARYSFVLGLDGFLVRRGDIVGIASDVLDRKTGFGVIKTVTRNGSNQVTAVTLDNRISWSAAQTDFGAAGDVDDLLDAEDTAQTMAIAIQKLDGTVIQKDVTDTTDGTTATMATPFVDDDVVVGLLVATGISGRVFRRARVLAVEPGDGIETRRVVLVDEAPELFA